MENVVELNPHLLGRALPLLFEHYKKAPQPFSEKHTESIKKTMIQEKFFTLKNILKPKFLGYDLFWSKPFLLNLLTLWVFCFVI